MTQKQSRQPRSASVPGSWFTGSGFDARLGPRIVRLRLLALVSRPKAPSLLLGIAVAAALIVIQTLIVCSLNVATSSTGRFGTLYLVGVLVVSTVWGFGLAATMSVASAIAFAYFRLWPASDFSMAESQNWLVIGVFLVVALVANALAGLARVGERFFVLSPDLLCITGSGKGYPHQPCLQPDTRLLTRRDFFSPLSRFGRSRRSRSRACLACKAA